jgi:hypothetical protein
MSYKGTFTPKSPKKYNGDSTNIIYRSNWELRVMKWLDDHKDVIWWSSEELFVRYMSPVDNKIHKYYPDFVLRVKDKTGKESTHMWEVKPYKQTLKPTQQKRTKKFIQEAATYAINQEKWRAAELFCLEQGWKFGLITEKDLGI